MSQHIIFPHITAAFRISYRTGVKLGKSTQFTVMSSLTTSNATGYSTGVHKGLAIHPLKVT